MNCCSWRGDGYRTTPSAQVRSANLTTTQQHDNHRCSWKDDGYRDTQNTCVLSATLTTQQQQQHDNHCRSWKNDGYRTTQNTQVLRAVDTLLLFEGVLSPVRIRLIASWFMGSQQRFWRRTPRTKNSDLRDRYSVSYLLRAGRLRASDILLRNTVPVQRIRCKKFLGPKRTLLHRYSVSDCPRSRRLRESAIIFTASTRERQKF